MNIFRLFFFYLFIVSLASSLSISSITFDKQVYEEGEEGVISIVIDASPPPYLSSNFKRYSQLSLSVNGVLVNYDVNLGEVVGRQVVSIPFKANKVGNFLHTVEIKGFLVWDEGSVEKERFISTSSSFVVNVKPYIHVWVENLSRYVDNTLSFYVCSDDKIENVRINLSMSTDPTIFYLNDVEGCRRVEFSLLPLFNNSGVVSAKIYMEFFKEGVKVVKEFPISFYYNGEPNYVFISLEGQLEPYKKKEYVIKFSSSEPLENVKIYFPSNLTLVGSNYLYFDTLNGLAVRNVSLIASLESGSYSLPFRVEWVYKGEKKTTIVNVPVVVNENPKVGVDVKLDSNLTVGDEGTVNVFVVNGGLDKIYNVVVSLDGENITVLDLDKEKMIGAIDGDDFSVEDFNVRVEGKKYALIVKVSFEDRFGNVYRVVEKYEGEAVYKKTDNTLYYLFFVIFALVILWILWKRLSSH